jgi:hypothetical protein
MRIMRVEGDEDKGMKMMRKRGMRTMIKRGMRGHQ